GLDQGLELRPPGRAEAAVAAAGPAAADVRLDDDDVAARLELLGPKRRPEPGVAAADDADVRGLRPLKRGAGSRILGGERLLEPERPVHGRGFSHSARFA